jgi:hypothetical protein
MDGGRGRLRGSLGPLVPIPSPGSALIRFTCERPDHSKRSERYTLTIHSGQWAFCAHEGATSDHRWRPIAGARLDALLDLRRSGRQVSRCATPRRY